MKKLIVLMLVVAAAAFANAASFKWSAANIYASNGTDKFSGTATLYCSQLSDWSTTADVNSGVIKATDATFSSDKFTVGQNYDFYFVITDNGKSFTSPTVTKGALDAQTQSIGFNNMATATQNASNWGTVPEPTSALLMVLGVAGLALRRRRV